MGPCSILGWPIKAYCKKEFSLAVTQVAEKDSPVQNASFLQPTPGNSVYDHAAFTTASTPAAPDTIQCRVCGSEYTGNHRVRNLARHKRYKHNGAVVLLCLDRSCKKVFKREDARLKHVRKHHPELASDPVPRPEQRKGPNTLIQHQFDQNYELNNVDVVLSHRVPMPSGTDRHSPTSPQSIDSWHDNNNDLRIKGQFILNLFPRRQDLFFVGGPLGWKLNGPVVSSFTRKDKRRDHILAGRDEEVVLKQRCQPSNELTAANLAKLQATHESRQQYDLIYFPDALDEHDAIHEGPFDRIMSYCAQTVVNRPQTSSGHKHRHNLAQDDCQYLETCNHSRPGRDCYCAICGHRPADIAQDRWVCRSCCESRCGPAASAQDAWYCNCSRECKHEPEISSDDPGSCQNFAGPTPQCHGS
ncbi:hypothetical protein BU25DRAFT_108193 [Macroventuria anomochaeta]|uniref:Uncharacterized protein n=1 Tax=Macroventuria anomochaeta TaxID=301207 RepID=A0ACB6RW50_9PLEO|nr:uncharacterized protein BU25DRAFT_108193 [Macroventuria anomochaeta]KAF2625645.1 hypothetical protein BU25DRAFT_108193 [Macroventuria anomochaeta]